MTYGEVKEKIRDYGFEDNSTIDEYASIVKNAVNTAQMFLFDEVVIYLSGYYKRTLSTEESEWKLVRPQYITDATVDSFEINLPDNIIELLPLLASYFVWLDDDSVKATLYWNVFDEKRQSIISSCLKDAKATITGGVGW